MSDCISKEQIEELIRSNVSIISQATATVSVAVANLKKKREHPGEGISNIRRKRKSVDQI